MWIPFPIWLDKLPYLWDPHEFHQRMKNMLDGGVVGIFHLYHIM